jgi:hypothetical protein
MNSAFPQKISFNEKLDMEAKMFALCFAKTLHGS